MGPAPCRLDRVRAPDRPGVRIDDWAAELVRAEGVLLIPGSQFEYPGNHFRLGFGRTDLPEALGRLEAFAERTLR